MLEPGPVSTQSPLQFIGPFDNVDQLAITIFALLFLTIGAIFFYYALREFYRGLVLAVNRPISAAAVATASGSVELEATAEPLDGSAEGERIAYKEERKKKETSRDADGDKKESWKTVSSSEWANLFRLADETGSVVVDPEGANLSIDMDRTKSTRRRRKYQGSITPGDTVHIYGHKRSASDAEDPPGNAEVFIGDGSGEFLISDTTQFRTVVRYLLSGFKYLFFALIPLAFGVGIGLVTLDMVFGINPVGI